ncbi:hypothetical protein [Janthinobacterium psychrotolerans]|uniref:Uncharacterized protein n=1 Tax=Janthinobacterium psychrotolerans TaxID=1747903 RepID=A0A1A7C8D0_9BURK|nr:hypothetical protein [Janthinobacterium psychrotolerans]OBV41030.1 hypothetical protein ASR47_102281 [Janthinobacterium psychrotolerans]
MMWLVGAILLVLIAAFLWMAFFYRVHAMSRQAQLLNWLEIGRVSNPAGGKDILLARNERNSKIDWRTGEVWLVNPKVAEPFADYLAVERWLAVHDAPELEPELDPIAAPPPLPEEEDVVEVVVPAGDTLPPFRQKVEDCLAKADGGQDLVDTKQAFEAGSAAFLDAGTELCTAALECTVPPMMVATFYISAFAALSDAAGEDKLDRVTASLQAAARQIRMMEQG